MCDVLLLKWDSNFFNRKIGKLTYSKKDTEESLSLALRKATQEDYKLIYVFDESTTKIDTSICSIFNERLVDTKIIFKKTIHAKTHPISKHIKSYTSNKIRKELSDLAQLSGNFSRFKTDTHFSTIEFTSLYDEWIEKSVARKIADEVFVYEESNKIIGFISVSIANQIGSISLIAVDPKHQGKNIGSLLLAHLENYLISNNIKALLVATQKINELACGFYKKNGFIVLSSQDIYHFAL